MGLPQNEVKSGPISIHGLEEIFAPKDSPTLDCSHGVGGAIKVRIRGDVSDHRDWNNILKLAAICKD